MDLKSRLNSIIKKDKTKNPQYIIDLIKSDIYYLLNNYFEIDFEDINVNISLVEEKYKIEILGFGERLKIMKVLPE